jgi:hypothetical protein
MLKDYSPLSYWGKLKIRWPARIDDDATRVGWHKLSVEIKLQILEWAFQVSDHSPAKHHHLHWAWGMEDCSSSNKGNCFGRVLRPWLDSRSSEQTAIAHRAFWGINTFSFDVFEVGAKLPSIPTPSLSLCKLIRYLNMNINLDPKILNDVRRLAASGKLDNVKHCNIRVDNSTNKHFKMEEETGLISVDALISSTKTSTARWLDRVHPGGFEPIRLPCPGTVSCPWNEMVFDSPSFSVRGGGRVDVEFACGYYIYGIIPHFFIFEGQRELDSSQVWSAKINAALQEPWR